MSHRDKALFLLHISLYLAIPFAIAVLVVPLPERDDDKMALASNRAYSGAPPVIPHQVAELGRGDCMSCHLFGDALGPGPDGKMAKATPHPELENCTGCHVEQRVDTLFRESDFQGGTYRIGLRRHQEAPWLVPHPTTMRENCLGCHHTPRTPERLLTTHPERGECESCHIPAYPGFPGPRPRSPRHQESSHAEIP